MYKKFIPTFYAKNIYEIPVDFFIKQNIKVILLDLDNTLDAYNSFIPSENAQNLINNFKKENIKPIVISNNKSNRVSNYCKSLNIDFISNSMKPFAFKIKRYLKQYSIDKKNVILIGDQTVTDIVAGNRAKIKTILCDKLVEVDQPVTRFNRFFDKKIRNKLKKKNLLKDWRIYGNN